MIGVACFSYWFNIIIVSFYSFWIVTYRINFPVNSIYLIFFRHFICISTIIGSYYVTPLFQCINNLFWFFFIRLSLFSFEIFQFNILLKKKCTWREIATSPEQPKKTYRISFSQCIYWDITSWERTQRNAYMSICRIWSVWFGYSSRHHSNFTVITTQLCLKATMHLHIWHKYAQNHLKNDKKKPEKNIRIHENLSIYWKLFKFTIHKRIVFIFLYLFIVVVFIVAKFLFIRIFKLKTLDCSLDRYTDK